MKFSPFKGKIRTSLVWTLTGQFLLQMKSNECLPAKASQLKETNHFLIAVVEDGMKLL